MLRLLQLFINLDVSTCIEDAHIPWGLHGIQIGMQSTKTLT